MPEARVHVANVSPTRCLLQCARNGGGSANLAFTVDVHVLRGVGNRDKSSASIGLLGAGDEDESELATAD